MQQVQEIKPQAYKSLSNCYTLEIALDDRFSDVVYYRHWGNRVDDWTEREIQYSRSGNPYFTTTHGGKHYLNEFMKY